MAIAQVTLTESQSQAIQALSQSKGKTPEDILHEAIEQFLARHKIENRLVALRQARGIWQGRRDLPDFAEIRSEWNRFEK